MMYLIKISIFDPSANGGRDPIKRMSCALIVSIPSQDTIATFISINTRTGVIDTLLFKLRPELSNRKVLHSARSGSSVRGICDESLVMSFDLRTKDGRRVVLL